MREPKRSRAVLRKSSQPEVFPPEIENLLDVLARIEARRQARLRALERKLVHATSEISL
jgi:hypothetical protein